MSYNPMLWIDIKNSHEPLLFKSLMRDLPYDFYITARDYAEVIGLLDKYGMRYRIVGKYHAKNKFTKAMYLGIRSLELAMLVPHYDFFLSHGSIYGIMASKLRRKKSITITDNDFYNFINKIIYNNSTFIMVPQCLNHKKFEVKRVFEFNGFKEDIYIANFNPQKCEKEIPFENYVLIRPEAQKAYYLNGEYSTLVPQLLKLLTKNEINIVLLPRYTEEREKYKKYKNVFIPEKPVNGLCAAYFAMAVLTGSGTLGREAACMGVPAVSFFPGKELLSVDREMINRGWLYHSREPQKIVKYVLHASQKGRSLKRSKEAKNEVITIIKEIVEGNL